MAAPESKASESRSKPSKSWFLTLINKDEAIVLRAFERVKRWAVEGDNPLLSKVVCQLEEAPTTKTKHWHAVIVLRKTARRGVIKALFDDLKVPLTAEPCRSEEAAARYCSKEGAIDGPYWSKGWEEGKASRMESKEVVALARSKSYRELLDEAPDVLEKRRRLIETTKAYWRPPDREALEVEVIYGPTGTGKTRWAYRTYPDCYRVMLSTQQWWEGYDGEEVIVLNDFDPAVWPPVFFNQVVDLYSTRIPVKGSSTWSRWTKVVITSNLPPDSWYLEAPEEVRNAVMRRITRVWYKPSRTSSPLWRPPLVQAGSTPFQAASLPEQGKESSGGTSAAAETESTLRLEEGAVPGPGAGAGYPLTTAELELGLGAGDLTEAEKSLLQAAKANRRR